MPVTTLDPKCALIVIDLQKGIAAYPTVRPLDEVVTQVNSLAAAFRSRRLPVVLVVAEGSSPGRTEHPSRAPATLPPGFTDLLPELSQGPEDHRITKRARSAFSNTDLDDYLRAQGLTQVVVTGVATSNGVESTARSAYELGYHVTLATDAMTDVSAENETYSISRIFPRLGETGTSADIIALLGAADA